MSAPEPPSPSSGARRRDPGLRRELNEDSFLAAPPLFLVADGMGGHRAGEIASAAVVEEFATLAGRPSLSIDDMHVAVERARRRVAELSPGGGAGAGTTLSRSGDLRGRRRWATGSPSTSAIRAPTG